jgi:hypothetical protein
MISCRLIAVMTALTLAPTGMAQQRVAEQRVTQQRVTELIDELKADKTRHRAVDELSRAGWVALPLLKEFLSRSGEDALGEKKAVLSILSRMGPDAAGELDFLFTYGVECESELLLPLVLTVADIAPYGSSSIEFLVGKLQGLIQWPPVTEEGLRATRIGQHALVERMKVNPEASTETLLEILKSNRRFQREVAAEELGRRRARAAIPLLSRLVSRVPYAKSGEGRGIIYRRELAVVTDDFKARAVRALLMIDPDDPRVAVAHGYQLRRHPDARTRWKAAMALGRCGAAAAPAVPDLLAAISDEDEDVRVIREAVTTLGMVGPKAADAVPILETLTQHENRQIAARAKAALRQIKGGL